MATKRSSTTRRPAKKAASPSASSGSAGFDFTEVPEPTDEAGRLSVIVELEAVLGASQSMAATTAESLATPTFQIDHEFEPVPVDSDGPSAAGFGFGGGSHVVRGTVANEGEMEALLNQPGVTGVWKDTPIAPFAVSDADFAQGGDEDDDGGDGGMAVCPIPPCDCSSSVPKGTIAQVAAYYGLPQVWAEGLKGQGMVVGVVDSGLTAQGRPVEAGQTARRIPRVVGGWPAASWGTKTLWGEHGNMSATDVLGMAPEARLYDLRVAGAGGSPGTISRALQAFHWAITRHRADGTPHVLTNSWGIWQEDWDRTYARNPNHPFTRKMVEAVDEGIIVLFAAGNCGAHCGGSKCGGDKGPGKSIWGANGHPQAITVGAVNRLEQFVGYSSQGPAALDPNKPDFCGITHFTGYFNSDNGTSAACPTVAGIAALMKQANPSVRQAEVKACLRRTAKDIGPPGFDQHSGAGIVQGKAAIDCVRDLACRRYLPYLRRVAAAAQRDAGLRAALCFYFCGGRRVVPDARHLCVLCRVRDILRRCPQYRALFCRLLRCRPAPDCRRYERTIRLVIERARNDERLRHCLCHAICGVGERRECGPDERRVVLAVQRILRDCPQYKSVLCRALDCPGHGQGMLDDDLFGELDDLLVPDVDPSGDPFADELDPLADPSIDELDPFADELDPILDELSGVESDLDDALGAGWGGLDGGCGCGG